MKVPWEIIKAAVHYALRQERLPIYPSTKTAIPKDKWERMVSNAVLYLKRMGYVGFTR